MTKIESCIAYLRSHKATGATISDIMNDLKVSKCAVYSTIYAIRNDRKIPVKFKNAKYYIGEEKSLAKKSPVKRSYVRHAKTMNNVLTQLDLPFDLPKDHATIPPDKKANFIDMIGQAAFYYWCSEAHIRVEKLKSSMS